jgi:cysteine synthase
MIGLPVIEKIEGVYVVRDDFIPGGTKRCFADSLIKGHAEVVYASPVYGGAQIAIAHAARENGVMATIFCAKRKQPHPRTLEAHRAGAKIVQVPCGYLSNVTAKARQYCERTGAFMLPFGLDSDIAIKAISDRASKAQELVGDVDQVWCVGGSGVL